jgi:hypothetical protein
MPRSTAWTRTPTTASRTAPIEPAHACETTPTTPEILGTLVTAGILGLVYIALAFILPIAATREA